MKNITLSIPFELLKKSREYAKKHGTTLNEMVRDLLRKTINNANDDYLQNIEKSLDELGIETGPKAHFNRDELHQR